MKQFEYKLVNTDAKGLLGGKVDMQQMTDSLNAMGKDGWDLVEIIGSNQDFGATRYLISVFKREIEG